MKARDYLLGISWIALLVTGASLLPVQAQTVTFQDGSTRYPTGTDQSGFVSQSDDSLGPIQEPPASVHFYGTAVGGHTLIYRYRLDFDEPVRIDSIVVEGAAWNRSTIRLLDASNAVLASTFITTGGNTFQSVTLDVWTAVGKTFYLEELNEDSHWRYRSNIDVHASPLLGHNLLFNPGFEEILAGWSASDGTAVYTADLTTVHAGSYSAKGIETTSGSLGRLYQDVTERVEIDRSYRIAGWLKTEVTSGWVVFGLDYVTSGGWTPAGGYIQEVGASGLTDWTYYETECFAMPPPPASATAIWFLFDFNAGTGAAYWDDLLLLECPDEASARITNPANGNDYQEFDNSVPWEEAASFCEDQGGHLVTITSGQENDFVFSHFGDGHVWLGGTDRGSEGVWRWNTGELWTYSSWDPGEPNNCGGPDCGEENHVTWAEVEGVPIDRWNDIPPSMMGFVCEWEDEPLLIPIIETIAGSFDPAGGHRLEVPVFPIGGVVEDSSGNILISDYTELFRVEPSGASFRTAGNRSISYSGDGGPVASASFATYGDVVFDSHGNYYIVDTVSNRVRKVDTDGLITTYAGTGVPGYSGDHGPAALAQLNAPYGIAIDDSDNLYIADTDNLRVRKVGSNGIITTLAGTGFYGHSGDGGPATGAEISWPYDVVVGSDGSVYIAEDSSVVRKVDAGGIISTFAGIPWAYGFSGDGGPATSAEFWVPLGLELDSAGNLYIGDYGNYRVRRVDADGIVTTVAGSGLLGDDGDGGPALLARIGHIWGLGMDSAGNLYLSDNTNRRVRRVNAAGTIDTFVGHGTTFYGENVPALEASISTRGLERDIAGNLIVADRSGQRIRRIDSDGRITTIAGIGSPGFGGDGGPAVDAQLRFPLDVNYDDSGNLFIADTGNHRIRRVDPGGIITTVAGTGTAGYGGDGGPAASAMLNGSAGVDGVSVSGKIYIADELNHRVRVIDSEGVIQTLAGTGDAGYSGDGGPATAAQLSSPTSVYAAEDGYVLIADRDNHRIRVVTPEGTIWTAAGTGVPGGAGDGALATSAQLSTPVDVDGDADGNWYIAEDEGHRIRRVDADGFITTVCGTGVFGYSGDGGPATQATLSLPARILVDDHEIFISDTGNARIRRLFTPEETDPPDIPLPEVSESAPGLATDARTGHSTAGLGDLDGDGLSDFITGAPSYTDESGDRAPGPEEAGAAVVYLGSTDEDERAFPDIVFLGEAAHDRAGVAVAGGFDFNGDNVNDFMIGAEQVDRTDPDNPVLVGAGKAYLIYFDPTDSTHYPNINDPTTTDYVSLSLVGQPGGIPGVVFIGEALGDQAGFALAGGGLIDPGTGHDIAIGAPGHDTSGGQDAGAVYAIFDDPTLTGTVSLADVSDTVDGVVYEGHAAGDALGFSVAFPGDVVVPDGEDIIMGAPLADVDSGADAIHVDAGIAYLGSAGTLSKGIIEVGEIGTEQDGAQVRGDQAGEQLGYSVAGGGDNLVNGEPDTLIGAPYYDNDTGPGDASLESAGRVAQLGGRLEKGIIEVGEIGTETDYAVAGAIYIGDDEGDRLGYAVAGLGDVTGDGTDDIGLGAPYADPDGLEDAGTIYIVEGYDDGTTEPDRGIIEVGEIGTSVAGRQVNGDEAGELAGFSMAETGDIDGDGSDDFVAGSPGTDEGEEEDTGSVSMVLESENLVVTPENQPPVADASATVTSWECEGELQAMVLLDGSASSDPDSTPGTADDIVSYDWWENGTSLGSGVQVSHSFALGSHPVTLEVRDQLGVSDADGITVAVADSGLPQGGITTPPAGTCFGPSELPVTVTDSFTDVCDPSLTRTYDPGPGPSYTAHGDYSVTLTVDDDGGNQATDSVGFTIDTVPPTVEWLGLPDRISIRPFNLIFSASDDDDAAGDVVREVMKLDGCVIYDGATFGPDPDGLLSGDVLRFSPSELCRIREECGFDILTGPELRVEATDCGGNVGHDAKLMTGRLILSNLPCAEPEEETRKESVRTPKRRKL